LTKKSDWFVNKNNHDFSNGIFRWQERWLKYMKKKKFEKITKNVKSRNDRRKSEFF
jgi:hypothetical protein